MRRRKDFAVCERAAWLIALIGSGTMALAQSLLPADDGWYAWTVDARDADKRCCFEWGGGRDDDQGRSTVCKLDGSGSGYGSNGHATDPTRSAVVYVKQVHGRIEQATALSASCRVSTKTPIKHLDDISAAQSVMLLAGALAGDDDLADELLVTLAAHAEPSAQARILDVAKDNDDAQIRSKAWFWLAQTQWARTETEIMQALVKDPSHAARQGAVFALSQLQDKRSSMALIKVVETDTLDKRDRKQALFWLAQDENPHSLDYLSEILVQ